MIVSFIDEIIMALIGLMAVLYPQTLVKPDKGDYLKKVAILKKCGYVLLGVSIILTLIKIAEYL